MTNETNAPVSQQAEQEAEQKVLEPAQVAAEENPEPAQETAEQIAAKEAEAERKAEKRRERRERKEYYELKAKAEFYERELNRRSQGQETQSQSQDDGNDIDSIVAQKVAELKEKEQAAQFLNKSKSVLEKAMELGDFDLEDFIELPPTAAHAIVEMDNPRIVVHLQSNPDLIDKLSNMSPYLQAVEIGRLDAQLSAPKPVKKSGAPAPITPLAAKKTGDLEYRPDMTDAEFDKWTEIQRKKLYGR